MSSRSPSVGSRSTPSFHMQGHSDTESSAGEELRFSPEPMESTQEGTHSIENLRSRRHNDEDDTNRQSENPSPVQKRTSRRGGRGQRGRGSRRGRVGRARQQELDEEDREFLPIINCELLIQLVEARPALWDQTDPKHSDHNTTRRQWQEVYANVVPTWNDLSRQAQKNCAEIISTRWRSIRDRFMRDLNHERTAPSGSGPSQRKAYQYAPHLQFLQRCFQQRMTHSSTLSPEAEPLEHEESTEQLSGRSTDQTSLPSQSQDSAHESRGRQTETCAQIEDTRQFISSAFDRVLSRPRPVRRPHRVFEDLALIFRDCLLKIEEEQTRYKQELTSMINHVEVVCRPEPLNPNQQFLLTLSHWMDSMTPEQNCDCRVTLIKTVWNIKHPPPSQFVPLAQSYPPATSYPTSMTSPPAHSYSEPHIAPQSQNFQQSQQSQNFQQSQNLPLSQTFSHSQDFSQSQNFPPSNTLPTYHNFPQAQNVGTAQKFPALQNFSSTSHIFIPSQSHPPYQRQPTSNQYSTSHTFPPSFSQSQSQLPSYVSAQTPFQSKSTGSSQTRLQTPSPELISRSTPNKISINEGVSTSVFPTQTTFNTPFSNQSVPYQSGTDSYSLHTPQHQQQGDYVRPQHSFMQSLLDQSAEDDGSPTAAPGKAPFTQPKP